MEPTQYPENQKQEPELQNADENTEMKQENTKARPPVQTLVCLPASMLLMFGLLFFSDYAVLSVSGMLVTVLFAAIYPQIEAYGGRVFYALPTWYGVAASLYLAAKGGFTYASFTGVCNVVLPLALSFAIAVGVQKKTSKSACFVTLSVVYTAAFVAMLALAIADRYQALNVSVIGQAIREFSDAVGNMYASLFETAQTLDPENMAELAPLFEEFPDMMARSVRASLPAFLGMLGMAAAAFTNGVFGLVSRLLKTKDRLLGGRTWSFELDTVNITIFYIIYGVYFVLWLFDSGSFLYVALANALQIMTYPFAYVGIRFLYRKLSVKVQSKLAGVVLLAAAFFALSLFFGGTLLTLTAFVGAATALAEKGRKTNKK